MEVNGQVCRDTTLRVSLEADRIRVDGKVLSEARESIVIALHKPVGYVTTRSDPQGRKTVYDLLPEVDRFVFPVGRLDRDTSGLLIFTDDHRLGEALTNPERHIPKTYEVVVDRAPDEAGLMSLRRGVEIGKGEVTGSAIVGIIASGAGGVVIRMTIEEGKNRQVRRMCSAVGLSVKALHRVSVGAYSLGLLPEGQCVALSSEDVARLLTRTNPH